MTESQDSYAVEDMKERCIKLETSNQKRWFEKEIALRLRTSKATIPLNQYDLLLGCNTTMFRTLEFLRVNATGYTKERKSKIEQAMICIQSYLVPYGECFIDWNKANYYILDNDSKNLLLAKQQHEAKCPFYNQMRKDFQEVQKTLQDLLAYFDDIPSGENE